MGDVDFSGADSVRQIQNELVRQNATLVLCAVDPAVRKLLDAYGLTDKIGAEHIFERPVDVVTAYSNLPPAAG
jgi:MFS superfamily sulfate permease-like transporter